MLLLRSIIGQYSNTISHGLNCDPAADSEQLNVVIVVEIVKVSLSRAFGNRQLLRMVWLNPVRPGKFM